MADIKPTVKKTKDAAIEALATVGGFLFGNFAMAAAKKFLPSYLVPAVGAVGLVPHFMNADDKQIAFGNGVLAAGTIEGLKRVTAGKSGILDTINKALPSSGEFPSLGYVHNGGFPLRGFGEPTAQDYALLNGPSDPGMRMLDQATAMAL